MRQYTVALTVALLSLTVLASSAWAAPPSPSFSVSCAVAGETVVTWKHVRVTSLDIDWYDSAGNHRATGRDIATRGREFSTMTPPQVDSGGRVEVLVRFHDGGAKLAPVVCS